MSSGVTGQTAGFPSQGKSNLLRDSEKRSAVRATDKARPWYFNQRNITSHLFFGPYVFFPIMSTLVWFGGLWALLAIWLKQGRPRYEADDGSIAFISTVGAHNLTLFRCITSITAGFYILSLFGERWLRKIDRLPLDVRRREKVFDWLAIFFGCLGAIALILLGRYDSVHHSTVHWISTVCFVLFVAISAIWQSAEIWSLHKDHPDRQHLRRNSILKLFVVVVAIALAIAFAALYGTCRGNNTSSRCNTVTSAAAVCEWAVAYVLSFYFVTLAMDLWPAGKTSPRYLRRLARWQEKHEPDSLAHEFTGRQAFDEYPERWQGQNGNALPVNGEPTPYPNNGNNEVNGVVHGYGNSYPNAPGYSHETHGRNSNATYDSQAQLVR